MSDVLVTGLVSAVVVGLAEGWRRAGLTGALKGVAADAETRTRSLGSNLGPRVEDLGERIAYVEGWLHIPKSGDPGTMEGSDGSRTGR